MKTTHYLLAALLLITGFTAGAQSWTGSWNSSFGELRLHQIGIDVHGDYRDLGDIDGRVNGNKLTGTFTNGNKSGSFIFTRTSNHAFTGQWKWENTNNWQEWNGSLKSSVAPVLTSTLAINKKRERLNLVQGNKNQTIKFTYVTFGDRKSNPDEFSIFGLASANLYVIENGNRTRYRQGPRVMNLTEGSAKKTKRTSSGVKLINFNQDFNIYIPNKEWNDPAKSFELEVFTDFKHDKIIGHSEFGKARQVFKIKDLVTTETYNVKASKGDLISNLYFVYKNK